MTASNCQRFSRLVDGLRDAIDQALTDSESPDARIAADRLATVPDSCWEVICHKIAHDIERLMAPDRCDARVYQEGEHVATIAASRATVIEAMVQAARDQVRENPSCQDVTLDWYYVAGRGVVRALVADDQQRRIVRQAVENAASTSFLLV